MIKNKERGAIVVEATIALTAFMFMMFTLYSIVDIYYIQSKMGVALNSAAKEISQYSYLYYKFNVDELDSSIREGSEDSRKMIQDTIDGSQVLLESLSGAKESIDTGNFEELASRIQQGAGSVTGLVDEYGEKIAKDPKGTIFGMGKVALSELSDQGKSVFAQVLAKTFMEKNLKDYPEDTPQKFLNRYRVVNGVDGLDYNYSTLMAYGTKDRIQLVVTYDVKVVQLLNLDIKFKFQQVAQTKAWGNGVSKKAQTQNSSGAENSAPSIWQSEDNLDRGQEIISKEKDEYTYQSSGNGYHAYDNSNGKNEFIKFVTMDATKESYENTDNIRYLLNNTYAGLEHGVSKEGNIIEVEDKDGNVKKIHSNPDNRTYKIVLVVPEDADMETVNKAVEQFLKEKSEAGEKVTVEVKRGYGNAKK